MHRRLSAAVLATATTLTLAAAAMPANAAITQSDSATATAASCPNGNWPGTVQGRPESLKAGAARGIYLWHSRTGWHLRATHRTHNKVVFTGSITASRPMRERPRKLEGADWVALSADRKTIRFRLTNYGGIDGFDFKTACAESITVTGAVQGKQLTSAQVFLGKGGNHPTSVPFQIERLK
jgi:hypothetical protein